MALQKTLNSLNTMGGLSSRLWAKFKNDAFFALYSPFVITLAAGTLERKPLENYIDQGCYFLKQYVEACKLAEGCEDNKENKNKEDSIRVIREEALKYAQQVQDLKKKQGMNNEKGCSPNMVTLEYSIFLLATAAGKVEGGKGLNPVEKTKIPAYTIAAMTPCSMLYSFLGHEITKASDSNFDHPHKEWIERIFLQDQGPSLTAERVLDKLAKPLTREDNEVQEMLYSHAFKQEIKFFYAMPLEQRTSVPLLNHGHSAKHRYTIVSDFDLSCSVFDSSAVLAEIAILTALKVKQNGSENPIDRKLLSDIWNEISIQYNSEEYDGWLRKILPSEKVSTLDYQALYKFMELLSQIEMEANSKFVESHVFRGINTNDIEKARELMQILKKRNRSQVDIHVISVRSSGDIVKAAFFSGGLNGLHIHSDDMEHTFDMEHIFMESFYFRTSIKKVKIFNNIWSSTKEYDMEHTAIYIGRDNLSDLLCLLKADIGIVVGTSSKLKRVGEHFGVSFVPLFMGVVTQERLYAKNYSYWQKQNGIIYTVSSWNEIYAFLVGFPN